MGMGKIFDKEVPRKLSTNENIDSKNGVVSKCVVFNIHFFQSFV